MTAIQRDAFDDEMPVSGRADARRTIRPIPRINIQAFCETHEVSVAVEGAAQDRRMLRAHVKVQLGGLDAAVEYYRDAQTPNLIIIESALRRHQLIDELERLSEVCDPGTKVMLIGHVNDVILYRELIRRGISEYIITPVQIIDIVEIISKLFSDPSAKPVGRSIAVIGAKGGVGASTLAHNIAWSIAHDLDLDTVIADMDLPFGTANLDFNQDPPQGIAEAVFSPDRLDSTMLDRLLSDCAEKLHLLAAPAMLDRPYDFGEVAFEPIVDILRAATPWVVLDVPHVWNGWTRRTLISADEVVIVAAPDLANLRNAKNLIDMLRQVRPNDSAPKLVLNQMGMPKRPEIKPADFTRAIGIEPVAVMQFDCQLFGTAANNGQMLCEVQNTAKQVESIKALCKLLTGRTDAKKAQANVAMPPFLQSLLQAVQKKI